MQNLYKKVNLSLSVIERKLVAILKRFYNKYIKGSINPVDIIRQKRGGYIYNQLTNAIRRVFKISKSDIVENRGIINALIAQQYEQFWITANKLRMREDELKPVPESQIVPAGTIPEQVKKSPFDVDASLIGFAAWLSFAAFNTGILLLSATTEEVIFMTRGDKKVDKKMCRPLHGRTFLAIDPACPRPPLHLHCRCMLLPSIS